MELLNIVQFSINRIEDCKNLLNEISDELIVLSGLLIAEPSNKNLISDHICEENEEYMRNTVDIIYRKIKVYHRFIFNTQSEDIYCPYINK